VLQGEFSVNRSNRLVIFVGVLLAILAFVGIVIVLNRPPSGSEGEQANKATVVIAKADIAIGDPVTPDKVAEKVVDRSAVLQTPLGSISQVTGQPALYAIPKDSQVTQEALGIGGGPSISRQLQPGEKAIAFQVDPVTGLNFLIQPGDHVDIVLGSRITVLQPTSDTVSKPANQQRFETVPGLDAVRTVKTVLQDKRVLYVSQTRITSQAQPGASPSPAAGGQAQAQAPIENVIIVIAGTDQDAEVIKFAQNDVSEVGPLTAVLRSTTDTDKETTSGITIDRLVSQYGLAIPNIVQQLQKAP
jgi:Flp pilus assembly protein CpaB